MCLTAGPDNATVPGGTSQRAIAVYGLGGDDQIHATNGGANIHGGDGYDTAYVLTEGKAKWDSYTERVIDKSGRQIQPKRAAAAPTQFVPPKKPPRDVVPLDVSVRCEQFSDGTFKIRWSTPPTVRAFNTIQGKVEFQDVAYAAGLDWWNGTRKGWFRIDNTSWRWDETYDSDWPPFPGNYWRYYDTLKPASLFIFTLKPTDTHYTGYYRVRVSYHWYAAEQGPYNGQTVDVPDYDYEQWVPTHYDQSNNATAGYPKDKYCAFGVDQSAGP
jgi:hypothetical protein